MKRKCLLAYFLFASSLFAQTSPDAELRLVPEIVDGVQIGLRIDSVSSEGRFLSLGVREGDLILAFNGESVNAFGVLREMLQTLERRESCTFRVRTADGMERVVVLEASE